MENNFSNFDTLDKLIANGKKAKSWTVFWVIILSLMAAVVLWMAFTVSKKNEQISKQQIVIKSNQEILEMKSRIIDSLTENCNQAKTEIIKDYDSVITQTQEALAIVNEKTGAGASSNLTETQKEKIKMANNTIERVQTNIVTTKAAIKKESTKLFVQYNNPKSNQDVESFLSRLKGYADYYIAPPEYLDKTFSTVIKFYNYKNEKEEKILISLISRQFRIKPGDILITYETNSKIKPTIEIWIGTRPLPVRTLK